MACPNGQGRTYDTGVLARSQGIVRPMTPLVPFLSTMALTVSLFAALSCLVQIRDRRVYLALAGVFLATVMMELGSALALLIASTQIQVVLSAIWVLGITSVTPLFYRYVVLLTREGPEPARLWPHLIVPALGLMLFYGVVSLPLEIGLSFFSDADGPLPLRAWVVGAGAETLIFIVLPLQWGVYLVVITRRLTRYRARLRDLFASTDQRELRWIGVVLGVFAAYWAVNVGFLLADMIWATDGLPDMADQILNLVLCGTLAIWGLRQRPGLNAPAPKRYAKSALDTPRATRIAGKLRHAMEGDALYLDANLSLWALSSHIGVTDNYVSQTLNEEIQLNFFDFVNGYRIEAAKRALRDSDATILAIAYDVGFNSRSSFYTAFRKVTGQTPSAFRAGAVRDDTPLSAPGDPDANGA